MKRTTISSIISKAQSQTERNILRYTKDMINYKSYWANHQRINAAATNEIKRLLTSKINEG